jgi:uncharacterized LabA/DUF88 family protein
MSAAERVAIFIDGASFARITYEGLGIRVDFKRLLAALSGERILTHAIYYLGEWIDDGRDVERRRAQQLGFIRMLNRNGYRVVRKPTHALADGSLRVDIGLELAIDMLALADRCDRAILVSGDPEFVPLVRAVAAKGSRVVVVGSQLTSAFNSTPEFPRAFPARVGDELLDAADEFVEVRDLVAQIEFVEARRGARPFVPIAPNAPLEPSEDD